MITYVKGQYVNDYNVLYKEAAEVLKEYFESFPVGAGERQDYDRDPENYLKIQDLGDYFSFMQILTRHDVDNNELTFTKLPLDEQNFVVDLNKREITVPKHFIDNGIGVRGDEIAEIVYFEVDRYFDATDLFLQDIIIEWVNAAGEKGYSRPYGKDVNLIPGKIVFGWPISSKVTPKDGNVQFAIRFYKTDDTIGSSGISFSLSTKLQTVKVNRDIDISLHDIINKSDDILADDTIDIIKARAKNSESENATATPGVPVIFYLGKEPGEEIGNGIAGPDEAMARVVYITTSPDDPEGAVSITAGVFANGDGSTTSSFWQKFKYEEKKDRIREVILTAKYNELTDEEKKEYDANFLQETDWLNYEEILVTEAQDEIRGRAADAAGILYYSREGSEETGYAYNILANADILAMTAEDGPVYRQDYHAIFTDVGVYQFVGEVVAGAHSKQTKSHYILVFPPVRPKDVAVGGPTKMQENAETKQYETTLVANMSPFGTELDADILPPSFVEYDKNKELYPFDGEQEWGSYRWFLNENVKTPIDELAEEDWHNIGGADDQELIATKEGYYKCGIVGHLNNHVSEEVISEPYRVTRPASHFVVTMLGKDQYGVEIASATDLNVAADSRPAVLTAVGVDGLTVNCTLDEPEYTDALTYKWYQYLPDDEQNKDKPLNIDLEDAVNAIKGVYVPDEKGSIVWSADILQEEATEANFIPAKGGIYFCVITNTYNEDTKVMCSPFMQFSLQQ